MGGLSQKDFDTYGAPFSFLRAGEVIVRTGPGSAQPLQADKIPLDGRHYKCAGEVILRNGRAIRAQFEIQTHVFDFLDRDSVWCTIDGNEWYLVSDPSFHELLGLPADEIFPYRWRVDRPLDYYDPGPYPMQWPEDLSQ